MVCIVLTQVYEALIYIMIFIYIYDLYEMRIPIPNPSVNILNLSTELFFLISHKKNHLLYFTEMFVLHMTRQLWAISDPSDQ